MDDAAAPPSWAAGSVAVSLGSDGAQASGAVESAEGAQTPIPEEAPESTQPPGFRRSAEEGAANVVFGQAEEEAVSLKGAVGKTQNRSKRRVPLIVLVALALALTSAIAFAAYYVYTTYFAPQQQEQAAEGSDANRGSSGDDQEAGRASEADVEAAEAAYRGIVEEYRQARLDIEGADASEAWEGAADLLAANRHLNDSVVEIVAVDATGEYDAYYTAASLQDVVYATKDLNGDGMPELLVGVDNPSADLYSLEGSFEVVDIWSFENDSLVQVADGYWSYGTASIGEDGVVVFHGHSQSVEGTFVLVSALSPTGLEDAPGALGSIDDYLDALQTACNDGWLGFMGANGNWDDLEYAYILCETDEQGAVAQYTVTFKGADGAVSTTTVEDDGAAEALLQEVFERYPEDTSIEWLSLFE